MDEQRLCVCSTGFAVTMAGRLAGRALGFLIAARQWPAGSPHPASTSRQVPFFFCADGRYFFRFSHQSFRLAAGHRVPVHPL